MNYIMRNEVVKAWQFDGNFDNAPKWIKSLLDDKIILFSKQNGRPYIDMKNLREDHEDIRTIYPSDYIIFYPTGIISRMDMNLFEALYVSIEELNNLK